MAKSRNQLNIIAIKKGLKCRSFEEDATDLETFVPLIPVGKLN